MITEFDWQDAAGTHPALWRSEAALPLPEQLVAINDACSPDEALARLQAGETLLWQGDWVRGRHLMQALTRLVDRLRDGPRSKPRTPAEAFELHRVRQGHRAGLLARLVVLVDGQYRVPLRRAQPVAEACQAAWGASTGQPTLLALRELLAVISAWEWRKKGVPVPALQGRLYPHYGVFSPVRGEYVNLVAEAPLPSVCRTAFDIGTGSGILAGILARRGVPQLVATDQDPRALACAAANFEQLGLSATVDLQKCDLFPAGRADLVVCNPPWVPAQPSSPIEYAVYDPDSRMLRGFLAGLAAHLNPGGEGWLIISDLAEHLGLRSRETLLSWIEAAGLRVLGRLDTRPVHPKAQAGGDLLHAARRAEVTSLWRLGL